MRTTPHCLLPTAHSLQPAPRRLRGTETDGRKVGVLGEGEQGGIFAAFAPVALDSPEEEGIPAEEIAPEGFEVVAVEPYPPGRAHEAATGESPEVHAQGI